jgi:hypothetical protein
VTISSAVRVRSRVVACVVATALFTSSLPAFAQSAADKATAVALFDEGKKLVKDGKFAEGCPKFELSQKLDPGVGTLGSLADCYERAGKVASAWTTWRETAAAAAAKGQADREKFARDKAKALEAKVPHFTIVVPNESKAPGLVVRFASTKNDLLWDIAIAADPGTYTIEASAPGRKPFNTTLTLVAGGAIVTITIPPLEAGAGPSTTPTTTVGTTPTEGTPTTTPTEGTTTSAVVAPDAGTSSGSSQKTIAYVVGGVGVVGIVVGTIFGLKAKSKNSEANDNCRPDDPTRCNSAGVSLSDDAHTAAGISTIAFAAGGAALVAGAVLWFTAPKESSKESSSAPSVGLGFGVAHGGIGLSAQGEF